MMAVEGPFLAALIARLDAPTIQLAAYGVAFTVAMLVEAPIVMIMSASSALVGDRDAYLKMRSFTFALNAILTAFMLVVLSPFVYWPFVRILGLPAEVSVPTRQALALFLPWPAAIGYRRLYQGMLIRSGSTKRVAYGTIIRLSSMAMTGLALWWHGRLGGASVAAAALSVGVVAEAIGSRIMARRVVRETMQVAPSEEHALSYAEISRFYYPLAMTSFLNMGIQPIVTFFMARGRFPLESLAVLPVINSLVFVFRTFGLACQETVIAMLARGQHLVPKLQRFAIELGLLSFGGLAIIAYTPLGTLWFERVSGLPSSLADFALLPTRILALMPALTVWMCFQRGLLVKAKSTAWITVATLLEVGGVVTTLAIGNLIGTAGIVSAAAALVAGRVAGALYLTGPVRNALRGSSNTSARKVPADASPVAMG